MGPGGGGVSFDTARLYFQNVKKIAFFPWHLRVYSVLVGGGRGGEDFANMEGGRKKNPEESIDTEHQKSSLKLSYTFVYKHTYTRTNVNNVHVDAHTRVDIWNEEKKLDFIQTRLLWPTKSTLYCFDSRVNSTQNFST